MSGSARPQQERLCDAPEIMQSNARQLCALGEREEATGALLR
jgi:hypothetical protein